MTKVGAAAPGELVNWASGQPLGSPNKVHVRDPSSESLL